MNFPSFLCTVTYQAQGLTLPLDWQECNRDKEYIAVWISRKQVIQN